MQYHKRLCITHTTFDIVEIIDSFDRKLFSPRSPTRVIVYTIYSLLKPLHTVLTVSEKDNIITSSLILNSCSIKMVILTYVFLSIDDYTLYVLYYIVMFFNLFLCFPLSLCNSIYLTCWIKRLFDLTWLDLAVIWFSRGSICVMDLPALQTTPFFAQDWFWPPAVKSMLAQEWTWLHEKYPGLWLSWLTYSQSGQAYNQHGSPTEQTSGWTRWKHNDLLPPMLCIARGGRKCNIIT